MEILYFTKEKIRLSSSKVTYIKNKITLGEKQIKQLSSLYLVLLEHYQHMSGTVSTVHSNLIYCV
jgi:hypothetical protein